MNKVGLHYTSNDKVKGKILDELAREQLGDWDPKVGNTILEQISAIFPSIEKILSIDSNLLVGDSVEAEKTRELFKEAALRMYDFICRKNIPPSLVAAIADTPQIKKKGKRFKRIFTFIDSIAARTELDKYELYPALEELVRKTDSFVDVERVTSRFNQFFADAEVLPEYTGMVAGLVGSGWKTETIADFVALTYQHLFKSAAAEDALDIAGKAKIVDVTYNPKANDYTMENQAAEIEEKWEELQRGKWKGIRMAHLDSLKQLVQSLTEVDMELLKREISLLPRPEIESPDEDGTPYTTNVVIWSTHGKRKLRLKNLEGNGSRFGLFLGLAGRLNQEYEFNALVSDTGLTGGLSKKVSDGTYLTFNHGEERITLKLEKGEGDEAGSIEVEGLASEELRLFLLDLQKVRTYVSAVYDAIDLIGGLPNSKKHLASSTDFGDSSVEYLSPAMDCHISDINLHERTAKNIAIRVNTEDKTRLYEDIKQIGLDAQFPFYAEMTDDGLNLELVLKGIPSATQTPMQDEKFAEDKKTLQIMLTAIDDYTVLSGGSKQCSLVDFLCYLNRNADREKLPELLSYGGEVLQNIGPLFVYPQTFDRTFEQLTTLERKRAVSVLYSVKPTAELSSAQEWLNKNYSDLAVEIGMDEVLDEVF